MKKQICLALLAALILTGTASDASACGLFRGWFRARTCGYSQNGAYYTRNWIVDSTVDEKKDDEKTTEPKQEATDAPQNQTPCRNGSCGYGVCAAEQYRPRLTGDSLWLEASPAPSSELEPNEAEAAIVAEVNAVRARYGLRPLLYDFQRVAAARRVASHNAANGVCGHPFPVDCGEICAAGRDAAGTAAQWENSTGHAAIILNPNATRISVGFAVGTLGGYWRANHWTARIW